MQQGKIQFRSMELCPMCNQAFNRNQNKEPRILQCGHDICSNCVKNTVLKNGFLTCPQCGVEYSKKACSVLKINQFYLNIMQNIEATFGKFHVFQQRKPLQIHQKQVNLLNRKTKHPFQLHLRENEMSQQFVKCKNSSCFKRTDLIFCSEDCQIQFQEVETKKNEGSIPNHGNGQLVFQI